ncbi:MAG TPA: hypothetical protein ENN07_03040 [candidate division Zixibacteria bacterium]|nr:hypothetical protein [candidate division Zixibacteria bacterium]
MSNSNSHQPDSYSVQFKKDRVDFFIDRNHLDLKPGEWVLVQAERGRDLGVVRAKISPEEMDKAQRKYPLEILHRARPEELDQLQESRQLEDEALTTCKELIEFRGLDMKLIDVERQFDGNKITFYFTADHRVDFRELVKDLASTYRTRIELRQIGVRDETKKMGGFGPCGQELCCAKWLTDFSPISTQYARDQNLAVNPGKLSGVCGRLFCCLDYEEHFYCEIASKFPQVGDKVGEPHDQFIVDRIDPFKMTVTIRNLKKENIEVIKFDEFNRRFRRKNKDWLEKWLPKKQTETKQ